MVVSILSSQTCLFLPVLSRNPLIKSSALQRACISGQLPTLVTALISNSIPVAYPNGPEGSISVRVISGKSHGIESPVRPLGGCWFFHIMMKKSGDIIFQDIRRSLPPFGGGRGSCFFLSRWLDIIHLSYVSPLTSSIGADSAPSVWKGSITVGHEASVNDSFHTLVLSNKDG